MDGVVWPMGVVFNIDKKNRKQTVIVVTNIGTILLSKTKFPVLVMQPVSTN